MGFPSAFTFPIFQFKLNLEESGDELSKTNFRSIAASR